MSGLAIALKLGAPIFLVVGALHLFFGLGADVLLGAAIPDEVMSDPVLDSQNRFYGVSFTLFGVLLFLCSTDIPKYAVVLKCVIWVFFVAGLARFISIGLYGMPSTLVLLLLVSELLLPPLIAVWLRKALSEA